MNGEAIFADGTKDYRDPSEPKPFESVTLRLRVGIGERIQAFVVSEDKKYQMEFDGSDGLFSYYACKVMLKDEDFDYHYEVVEGDMKYYYDRVGVCQDFRPHYSFSITPGFSTPDWAKGAVMYQILVDRFYNGDESNDIETNEYFYIQEGVERITDWNRKPANFDVAKFYGGDIEGVRQKLYYLKSLGVEVIYFNPLFVSPSNHRYDTSDYDYIDPHLTKIVNDGGECLQNGDRNNQNASKYKQRVTNKANLEASNAYFAEFVKEAHARGIKVILDGVFNHCGSFNKWLNREKLYTEEEGYPKGAYEAKDSPYNSYFKFNDENAWPDNGTYEGWWGYDTLPKLNYEDSEDLYNYILEIGKKWVSEPYNCDGWRLDVAADLGHSEEFNHKFWRDFRKAVKSAKPDAIILAEHYGNARAWLTGDQWDTVMNYDAFMEPVTYYLTGMEKHSDEFQPNAIGDGTRFQNSMLHFMANMKTPSLHCAMNQLSNHDHSRFLTRTNHVVGRVDTKGSEAAEQGVSVPIMKEAVLMQMTWPGAPTLYYGDEAGVCGFTDPDNRRTFPWGHANYDLIDYHRDMIMVHRLSPAIRYGSFRFLKSEQNFISYARFLRNEQVVVVVNSSDREVETDIPVWQAGVPLEAEMVMQMLTNERGYSIMPLKTTITGGKLHVKLTPFSAVVYKREEK